MRRGLIKYYAIFILILFSLSLRAQSGPFLESKWGTVNCKDENGSIVNVTNIYTPNNYSVGCVALTLAEVLHYYKWPLKGMGSKTYSDTYGSSTGSYTANFGETDYSMYLMKDEYHHRASTLEERQAAGKLAYHAAVSVSMDFEYNGSTSNVNRIPKAAMDHFRYYSYYRDAGTTGFWEKLEENLYDSLPVIFAIKAPNGAGHAVVCDGINYAGGKTYYHLSMGWWGVQDGWYPLQDSWDAGGYTSVTGAVFDIIPEVQLYKPEMLEDNRMELNWDYPAWPKAQAYEVQIRVQGADWEVLKSNYTEDSLVIELDQPSEAYYFRVRAMVNNQWYSGSWSNIADNIVETVEKETAAMLKGLYPNPFREVLYPEEGLLGRSIQVLDLWGRPVFSGRADGSIDTSSWPSGIYLVRIDLDGTYKLMKMIKR